MSKMYCAEYWKSGEEGCDEEFNIDGPLRRAGQAENHVP
jgi:hypothetical protein